MRTIEETAESYLRKKEYESIERDDELYTAFIAGVEFAMSWISIEEEFPLLNETVLVKTETGRISISKIILYQGVRRWQDPTMEITHWRPIELK